MITLLLPEPLQPFADGHAQVEVCARTVREVCEGLHPEIRRRIFDDAGQLRRFVLVYVNEIDVRELQGLSTPLRAGDEVAIIPAICTLFWGVLERDLWG